MIVRIGKEMKHANIGIVLKKNSTISTDINIFVIGEYGIRNATTNIHHHYLEKSYLLKDGDIVLVDGNEHIYRIDNNSWLTSLKTGQKHTWKNNPLELKWEIEKATNALFENSQEEKKSTDKNGLTLEKNSAKQTKNIDETMIDI